MTNDPNKFDEEFNSNDFPKKAENQFDNLSYFKNKNVSEPANYSEEELQQLFQMLTGQFKMSQKEIDASLKKINRLRKRLKKKENNPKLVIQLIDEILLHTILLQNMRKNDACDIWFQRGVDAALPFVESGDNEVTGYLGVLYLMWSHCLKDFNEGLKNKDTKRKNSKTILKYSQLAQKYFEQSLADPYITFEHRIAMQKHFLCSVIETATYLFEEQKSTAAALAMLEKISPNDISFELTSDEIIDTFYYRYYNILGKCLSAAGDVNKAQKVYLDFIDYVKELPSYGPHILSKVFEMTRNAALISENKKKWLEASSIYYKAVTMALDTKNDPNKNEIDENNPFKQDNQFAHTIAQNLMNRSNAKEVYEFLVHMAEALVHDGHYQQAFLMLNPLDSYEKQIDNSALCVSRMDIVSGKLITIKPITEKRLYLMAFCMYKLEKYDKALELINEVITEKQRSETPDWDIIWAYPNMRKIEQLWGDIFFNLGQYELALSHYIQWLTHFRCQMATETPSLAPEHAQALLTIARLSEQFGGEPRIWLTSAIQMLDDSLEKSSDPDIRYALAKACCSSAHFWFTDKNRPLDAVTIAMTSQQLKRTIQLINTLRAEEYDVESDWSDMYISLDILEAFHQNLQHIMTDNFSGQEKSAILEPMPFDPVTSGTIHEPLNENEMMRYGVVLSDAENLDFLIMFKRAERGKIFTPINDAYPKNLLEKINMAYQKACHYQYALSLQYFIFSRYTNPAPPEDFLQRIIDLPFGAPQMAFQILIQELYPDFKNLKFPSLQMVSDFIDKVTNDPQYAEEYVAAHEKSNRKKGKQK